MYRLGFRGLGTLDYYGLLAQANLENCDPRDSACVSNNVAKQAAVEDLWATKYQTTGAPDDLNLDFIPQSAAQVAEFYNPSNPLSGGNVIDNRGIMAVGRGDSVPVVYNPIPVAPAQPAAAKAIDVKPAGKTVVNSSGPAPDNSMWVPGASFSASSVPWWAWLAGGGALLLAFKGGR